MAFKWFKKKKNENENEKNPDENPDEKPDEKPDERSDEKHLEEITPTETEASLKPETALFEKPKEIITPAQDSLAANLPAKDKNKNKSGFFQRLKKGLTKTRKILTTDIDKLFSGKKGLDDEMLDDLEELLITSDIGVQTSLKLISQIKQKASEITGPKQLKKIIKEELLTFFQDLPEPLDHAVAVPHIIMVVGVNGVGKTTTIGKLAARETSNGKKVLIAAADTFRAAAVEQLTIWAERAGADIIKHNKQADPAAVAFDSVQAAIARKTDVVFVDTAGRLHTKVNLMSELEKIKRSISKKLPDAPHEVLLVLDATTGQNALSQAEQFHKAIGVTGIALTKLDGTAKGGIIISICDRLNIPLKYIGVGEGLEDLKEFDPNQFIEALF